METAAPTKFGKYDVVGVLGKGAMGIVYDCRDPVIGRRVAIKTVLKESLDSSEAEGLLGRFKQEAQAAGRLNHPGVVSIYDYGETSDVAFIAMEYISGKELKSYFDKGEKFPLTDTVRIMSAILEALEHAHQSKVVHRDIKPANIMITDDARVKVADFGVAKIESSLATQIGTRVGTPAYMAPEQHRMMAVDGRADLFSCGVILYQFLTHGARPFTGGSQTIARNILTQTPTPPSQINVELLPVWDQVVKKALAKRADERYQSAREFIDALRRAMGDLPAAPAGQSSGADDATRGGGRPAAEQAAPAGAATNTNSGRPERTDLAMESELEFWKEIKDSDHPDDFAAFIDSFPEGRFSHLAKRRLDKLNRTSGRAAGETDQTELSAGHTVAKAVPGSTTQSGAGPLENKTPAPSDGVAAREAAERARQEAEQQAQREAESRQREAAAARQREEAELQARRAATEQAEQAEREARARAQQEAEERKQQAMQREAARIAAEKDLLQQQEQAKREAEAKRELEAQKRKDAEEKEKALKAAQERKSEDERRQRESLEKREAEAKAKRDALEQERQKKEADAKAAKEAQAAKELAERNRRETEKAARETEERTRKEAQAKRAAEELAKTEAARIEREAADKARRGAAAQAEADATVIRQVNVGAAGSRPAEKAAAVPAPFDPDATAIRHVDSYAVPTRPGAAAGGDVAAKKAGADAEFDVDIDLIIRARHRWRIDRDFGEVS